MTDDAPPPAGDPGAPHSGGGRRRRRRRRGGRGGNPADARGDAAGAPGEGGDAGDDGGEGDDGDTGDARGDESGAQSAAGAAPAGGDSGAPATSGGDAGAGAGGGAGGEADPGGEGRRRRRRRGEARGPDDRSPATGDRPPATGHRPPATGDRPPATGQRLPEERRPGGPHDQRAAATDERKPGTGGDRRPGGSEDRRPGAGGDRRPGTGDRRPGAGADRRPGAGDRRPGGGGDRRPGAGADRRPGAGGDRRPADRDERKTRGDDRGPPPPERDRRDDRGRPPERDHRHPDDRRERAPSHDVDQGAPATPGDTSHGTGSPGLGRDSSRASWRARGRPALGEPDHDDAEPSPRWERDDDSPAPAITLAPDLPPPPAADEPDPASEPSGQETDDELRRGALANVVGIKFGPAGRIYDFDAGDLSLAAGERVVVDSERGPRVAQVALPSLRRPYPGGALRRVLRRPSAADLRLGDRADERGGELLRQARQLARDRRWSIKLYRAESRGGGRALLYFSSDERVDVRDMLRDLSSQLSARVELRQTGVRDEAKAVGGIGSCGQELCCTTFLPSFAPVSIKMAKDQGLVLNPTKINGQCGRLKCCLVYEHASYAEMRRGLPRIGKRVVTEDGEGRVVEVDVLRQRIRVAYGPGEFTVYPAGEVKPLFPSGSPGAATEPDAHDAHDADADDGHHDEPPPAFAPAAPDDGSPDGEPHAE